MAVDWTDFEAVDESAGSKTKDWSEYEAIPPETPESAGVKLTQSIEDLARKEGWKRTPQSKDTFVPDLLNAPFELGGKLIRGAYNIPAQITHAYEPLGENESLTPKVVSDAAKSAAENLFTPRNMFGMPLPPTPLTKAAGTVAEKTAKSLGLPENIAAIPFFESKLARAAMLASSVIKTPEQVDNIKKVFTDPKSTREQKWEALGDAGVNLAMTVGLAKSMSPAKVRAQFTPEEATAAVETKAETPQQKEQDASSQQKAAEVHGDVRQQPVEGEGKVPTQEGGAGIQPHAQGAEGEIPLKTAAQVADPNNKLSGAFTENALRYGASITKPEQLDELNRLRTKFDEEWGSIPQTMDNVDRMNQASSKRQWINEAIQAATGEVDEAAKKTLGPDYKPPFPKEEAPHLTEEEKKTRTSVEDLNETLRKQGLDPSAFPNAAAKRDAIKRTNRQKAEALAGKLEGLKIGAKFGGKQTHAFGIASLLWDEAINIAQAVIKGGGSVADGIQAFISHVKSKLGSQFDEEGARKHLDEFLREDETHGIAARVSEKRAEAGKIEPVPAGEGISAEGSVEKGRQLLANGVDPHFVMDQFKKTGRFNADDVAVLRAHGEVLAKAAKDAAEQYGTSSPEYQAAKKADNDWTHAIKPMQTEWHRAGQAQQGEVDIDTGTFHGLQHAYNEVTGKDFTPKQEKVAKEKAQAVKKAEGEAAEAGTKLNKAIGDQADAEQRARDAANKTVRESAARKAKQASKAQADPIGELWKKAKIYLDQGVDKFDDMIQKLATDMGWSTDRVRKSLARNKAIRRLADDAWRKNQKARLLKQQAKQWLIDQQAPILKKIIPAILREAFSIKVIGHAGVALGTHAPMLAFQPKWWGTYFRDFGQMWKIAANKAAHEALMQDLLRRPNWTRARRAGLENDPFKYGDYHVEGYIEKAFPNLTQMGNRGYDILQVLRQDMFDKQWDKLSQGQKSPEMAAALAESINHVTGVVQKSRLGGAGKYLFAPRLLESRFRWAFVDPKNAAVTGARVLTDIVRKTREVTPEEKDFAMNQVREKATVLATMTGMLLANQALLIAAGSNQRINFFDPTRSDWLKFKAAGKDISYGNAMLTTLRLPWREAAIIWHNLKFSPHSRKRFDAADRATADAVEEYLRNQFNPAVGATADILFQKDAQGRPLPLSNNKVPAYLRRRGVTGPYTWAEWARDTAMPIPLEESVKQIFNDYGVEETQAQKWTRIMGTAIFMGGTGGRVSEDGYADTPNP